MESPDAVVVVVFIDKTEFKTVKARISCMKVVLRSRKAGGKLVYCVIVQRIQDGEGKMWSK